ncbi:MAG: glucose 1-dehydrogenase [Ramlibacter sp.]|nr:glucose 1-dehydrogenase [Ramlibacter sp.]
MHERGKRAAAGEGSAAAAQAAGVAIITGAAQGIGRSTLHRFVRAGAQVLACDMKAEVLDEARASSGCPERVSTLAQDITAASAPADAVAAALEAFGRVDWLVNNAGIGNAKAADETGDAEWDRFLDVNLRSAFRYARAVLPHLQAGRGVIVHVASIFGILGNPRSAAYAASKAALIGLTRQMAADYGPRGIRINAVAPGVVPTQLSEERLRNDAYYRKLVAEPTPFHRLGKPEDIANAAWFLCSDEAGFINGHTLVVDGGWSVTNYVPR